MKNKYVKNQRLVEEYANFGEETSFSLDRFLHQVIFGDLLLVKYQKREGIFSRKKVENLIYGKVFDFNRSLLNVILLHSQTGEEITTPAFRTTPHRKHLSLEWKDIISYWREER